MKHRNEWNGRDDDEPIPGQFPGMDVGRNGKPIPPRKPDNPRSLPASIREGMPIAVAFRLAGFTSKQQEDMLAADPDLRQRLDSVSAEHQRELLGYIKQAAQHDYKAAAWLLSNHPDHRETFAPANKAPQVVQVQLLYDRDYNPVAGTNGTTIIDVPVLNPLLPAPDDD